MMTNFGKFDSQYTYRTERKSLLLLQKKIRYHNGIINFLTISHVYVKTYLTQHNLTLKEYIVTYIHDDDLYENMLIGM